MPTELTKYSELVVEDSSGGGTVSWNNPGNAANFDPLYDDYYADAPGMTSGQITKRLKFQNFGFNIPAGATINSYQLSWTVRGDTDYNPNAGVSFIKDYEVYILNGSDVTISGNQALATPYGSDITTNIDNDWGIGVTPSVLNNLRVFYSAQCNGAGTWIAFCYNMSVSVKYTGIMPNLDATGGTKCGGSAFISTTLKEFPIESGAGLSFITTHFARRKDEQLHVISLNRCHYSLDEGKTWKTEQATLTDGQLEAPLAVDSQGNHHFSYITGVGNTRVVLKSKVGSVWLPEEAVSNTNNSSKTVVAICPRMNSQDLWIIWIEGNVLKARRRTSGTTWDAIENISDPVTEIIANADCAMDANGYLHAAYKENDAHTFRTIYKKRTTSWSDPEVLIESGPSDSLYIRLTSDHVPHVISKSGAGTFFYYYLNQSGTWSYYQWTSESNVFNDMGINIDAENRIYLAGSSSISNTIKLVRITPSIYGPSVDGPHTIFDFGAYFSKAIYGNFPFPYGTATELKNGLAFVVSYGEYLGLNSFVQTSYLTVNPEWEPQGWTAQGGSVLSGVAYQSRGYIFPVAGGIVVGGASKIGSSVIQPVLGGTVCNGTAIIDVDSPSIYTNNGMGGVKCGGLTELTLASLNLVSGGVIVSGFVPPSSNQIANGGVTCGGNSLISIASTMVITGGIVCSGTWNHLLMSENSSAGGVKIGGSAGSPISIGDATTGGVIVTGTTIPAYLLSPPLSGGGVCSGTVKISHEIVGTGGVLCGSSANNTTISQTVVSGGIKTNGTATVLGTFTVSAMGGVVVSGNVGFLFQIIPATSGGVVLGGSHLLHYTANPIGTGGTVAGGLHIHTFFDYVDGTGGAKTGGKSRIESLRQLNKFRTGICRTLASENICDVVIQPILIPPTSDISPVVVNQSKNGNYCLLKNKLPPGDPNRDTFNEDKEPLQECDEGFLATIIARRQRGLIPKPKTNQKKKIRGFS